MLVAERETRGLNNVVISRLEQISPFPYDMVRDPLRWWFLLHTDSPISQMTPHLDRYPNADLLWCQEEPLNNGAWTYVGPRILTAANETAHHKGKYPYYAGRPPYSSVATGSKVGAAFLVR